MVGLKSGRVLRNMLKRILGTIFALLLVSQSASAAVALRAVATASSANQSCQVAVPAGTANNDFMIAQFSGGSTVAAQVETDTPPAGWTKLGETTTPASLPSSSGPGYNGSSTGGGNEALSRGQFYYRFAGCNEPLNYTWSYSPTTNVQTQCGIVSYTGVNGSTPIDNLGSVASNDGQTIGTAITDAVLSSTISNDMLLIFISWTGTATTLTQPANAPAPTQRWRVATDRQPIWFGDVSLGAPGATTRYTATLSANDYWVMSKILLAPGAGPNPACGGRATVNNCSGGTGPGVSCGGLQAFGFVF